MSNYPEQVRRRGKRCTTDVIEWLLGSVTDGGSNLFENDVEKLVAAAQICKDMGIRPPPDIEVKWNTSIADRKEITSWHVVHSKTAERVEQNERHAHFNERWEAAYNILFPKTGRPHVAECTPTEKQYFDGNVYTILSEMTEAPRPHGEPEIENIVACAQDQQEHKVAVARNPIDLDQIRHAVTTVENMTTVLGECHEILALILRECPIAPYVVGYVLDMCFQSINAYLQGIMTTFRSRTEMQIRLLGLSPDSKSGKRLLITGRMVMALKYLPDFYREMTSQKVSIRKHETAEAIFNRTPSTINYRAALRFMLHSTCRLDEDLVKQIGWSDIDIEGAEVRSIQLDAESCIARMFSPVILYLQSGEMQHLPEAAVALNFLVQTSFTVTQTLRSCGKRCINEVLADRATKLSKSITALLEDDLERRSLDPDMTQRMHEVLRATNTLAHPSESPDPFVDFHLMVSYRCMQHQQQVGPLFLRILNHQNALAWTIHAFNATEHVEKLHRGPEIPVLAELSKHLAQQMFSDGKKPQKYFKREWMLFNRDTTALEIGSKEKSKLRNRQRTSRKSARRSSAPSTAEPRQLNSHISFFFKYPVSANIVTDNDFRNYAPVAGFKIKEDFTMNAREARSKHFTVVKEGTINRVATGAMHALLSELETPVSVPNLDIAKIYSLCLQTVVLFQQEWTNEKASHQINVLGTIREANSTLTVILPNDPQYQGTLIFLRKIINEVWGGVTPRDITLLDDVYHTPVTRDVRKTIQDIQALSLGKEEM